MGWLIFQVLLFLCNLYILEKRAGGGKKILNINKEKGKIKNSLNISLQATINFHRPDLFVDQNANDIIPVNPDISFFSGMRKRERVNGLK